MPDRELCGVTVRMGSGARVPEDVLGEVFAVATPLGAHCVEDVFEDWHAASVELRRFDTGQVRLETADDGGEGVI